MIASNDQSSPSLSRGGGPSKMVEGSIPRASGEGRGVDIELQPYLARDALDCMVELLTGQHKGAVIRAEPLGAVMMLIKQAGDAP